jgi:hypothetical protein
MKFVCFVDTGAVFVCRLFDGGLLHRRSNSNKLMESNKYNNNHEKHEGDTTNA